MQVPTSLIWTDNACFPTRVWLAFPSRYTQSNIDPCLTGVCVFQAVLLLPFEAFSFTFDAVYHTQKDVS